jgi:hypothetical protein
MMKEIFCNITPFIFIHSIMYLLIFHPFSRGLICRSFFLFILFLSASACSKSSARDTHIYGQVRTYGTEEVMDHPPVKVQLLHERTPNCFLCGHYYHVQDEVWTDSLGRYELHGTLYEDEDYFLAVEESTVRKGRVYIKPEILDLERNRIVRYGGSYEKHYYLTAYGWVRFHILSTDPQPGDIYAFSVGGGSYEEFYDSVNVYRTWDFGGNMEHSLIRTFVRDGIYTPVEEHFFVPAFDTIDYEVRI